MSLLHYLGLAKASDVYRAECAAVRAETRASLAMAKASRVEAELRELKAMMLHSCDEKYVSPNFDDDLSVVSDPQPAVLVQAIGLSDT